MQQLSKISDILNDAVFDQSRFAFSFKKAVAFSFWKNISGTKFSNFSKPFDIKGNVLFVAVKNPSVTQELIFYKDKLLKKINDYFLPLDIQIEDIKYDYKVWNKVNSNSNIIGDETLEDFTKNDLEDVSFESGEKEEILKVSKAVSNLSFLNQELKEKYMNNIINSIKAKKLRNY